jgi:amidase
MLVCAALTRSVGQGYPQEVGPMRPCSNVVAVRGKSDIEQLRAKLMAGTLTSRELVERYLARIDELDRKGPRLNSIMEINPDALAIAERLDHERRQEFHGLMYGIPVLLKDNIDTHDGMLTTAGSLALVGSRPQQDAFIVRRLRRAGAVILGKTNMSEWANGRSTHGIAGWSARGGLTRNAYASERSAGGSSSGSAVAIAAGLATVAVGTETDGSLVSPAAMNGIVAIKPTVGLVSRSGIVPLSNSQDTPGAMARSVADATLLLSVLAGYDPNDPATLPMRNRPASGFIAELREGGLRGARVGVARNLQGSNLNVRRLLDEAITRLRAAGAVVVDPVTLEGNETILSETSKKLRFEIKDGLNRYLADRDGGPRSLAELIAFNVRERMREMPYFGQEVFLWAERGKPLTRQEYQDLRDHLATAAGPRGIDAVLKKHELDAIIAPTTGPAWAVDVVGGDHPEGGDASTLPAIAGYPLITVPAGFVDGLPIGLSFIGTAWSESTLIRLAFDFERVSRARERFNSPVTGRVRKRARDVHGCRQAAYPKATCRDATRIAPATAVALPTPALREPAK